MHVELIEAGAALLGQGSLAGDGLEVEVSGFLIVELEEDSLLSGNHVGVSV